MFAAILLIYEYEMCIRDRPVPVERQVMIIYAAINKYLADIGADSVKDFEKKLYKFMSENYPHVEKAIKESGQISEDTEKQLCEGIELAKKEFEKESGMGSTIQGKAD